MKSNMRKEGEKRSKNETEIKDGDDHIGHKEEEFAESLFARPSVLTIPTKSVGCLCQYHFFSVFLNEASMAVFILQFLVGLRGWRGLWGEVQKEWDRSQ